MVAVPEGHAGVEHGDDDVRGRSLAGCPRRAPCRSPGSSTGSNTAGRSAGTSCGSRTAAARTRRRCAPASSAAAGSGIHTGGNRDDIEVRGRWDVRPRCPTPAPCVLLTAALRSAPSLNFTITESGRYAPTRRGPYRSARSGARGVRSGSRETSWSGARDRWQATPAPETRLAPRRQGAVPARRRPPRPGPPERRRSSRRGDSRRVG